MDASRELAESRYVREEKRGWVSMSIVDLALEVHPSIVYKLGADLITDDYQALVELVKNAYDADSPDVEIAIDTRSKYLIEDGAVRPCRAREDGDALVGSIDIRDHGTGMSLNDIRRGWLTISASKKRDMKQLGLKTDCGRTPLGDKGLGRLGAQRLGELMELKTRQEGHSAYRVLIDWRRFGSNDALSSIKIPVESSDVPLTHGTCLRIIGLNDLRAWEDPKRVQSCFADMISPYSENLGFRAELYLNDERIDLREGMRSVLNRSSVEYVFDYNGRVLNTSALVKLDYLADLRTRDEKAKWRDLIAVDSGASFYSWLIAAKKKQASTFGLEQTLNGFGASFGVVLEDIDGIVTDEHGAPLDPGDFHGRVDFIQRSSLKTLGSLATETFDEMKGVKVYRDGFKIPLKGEIISFARQWSTGKSWYSLRPDNVVGYIALSAEHNAHLEEATNREEFRESGYYLNLQSLLDEWLRRTAELQTFLRKSYKAYQAVMTKKMADLEGDDSLKAVKKRIEDSLDVIGGLRIKGLGTDHNRPSSDAARTGTEIRRVRRAVDILQSRAEDAEDQLRQCWELVGLGIIAESVAHELGRIANRLTASADSLAERNARLWNDIFISDNSVEVRGMANALRKQVSHLDSSLRYVRNRKDVFWVSKLIESSLSYFESGLSQVGIRYALEVVNDFRVRMNIGRFIQVIDNFVINSEYWLKDALRNGKIESREAVIHFIVDSPYILIWDSGLGVDESVVHTLFDPFVSRKREGRGLGLYIVSQFLEDEGGSVVLEPELNQYGRRFRFRVAMGGVQADD